MVTINLSGLASLQSVVEKSTQDMQPKSFDPMQSLLHSALKRLANVCDGAASQDGQGFNGLDTYFGRSLAFAASEKPLTLKQVQAAYKMVQKYLRTQLPDISYAHFMAEQNAYLAFVSSQTGDTKIRTSDFIEKHPASDENVARFVRLFDDNLVDGRDRDFVRSLKSFLEKRGQLTAAQMLYAKKFYNKFAEQTFVERLGEARSEPVSQNKSQSKTLLEIKSEVDGEKNLVANNAEQNKDNSARKVTIKLGGNAGRAGIGSDDNLPAGGTDKIAQEKALAALAGGQEIPQQPAKQSLIIQLGKKPENSQPEVSRPVEIKPEEKAVQLKLSAAVPTPMMTKEVLQDVIEAQKKYEIQLDESQLAAIEGMKKQKFACLTGAAGTGKTTIENVLVREIEHSVIEGNIKNYGRAKVDPNAKTADIMVRLIAFCAYTGKAMQQMKKNLDGKWHANCKTIHSLLGYYPEYYEDYDYETKSHKMKRRFVPLYTQYNKMPWKIIFMDEGSMVPIALWEKFQEALQPDCRVYVIGDINQLPPVHGRSVFGFQLLNWPSFELTKIHRNAGPIVQNAWRILNGQIPHNIPGVFDMIPMHKVPQPKDIAAFKERGDDLGLERYLSSCKKTPANQEDARKWLINVTHKLATNGSFNPKQTPEGKDGDAIIVPQNKDALGQVMLNEYFSGYFNPIGDNDDRRRHHIVTGVGAKFFAIGDKVMVTENDHEIGITNGMMGMIVDITVNGDYRGKHVTDAAINLGVGGEKDALDALFKLEQESQEKELKEIEEIGGTRDEVKDDRKSRAASHCVYVDFGPLENFPDVSEDSKFPGRFVVVFKATGEVNSLMHAYVVTCHKLQGSECPTIIILIHSSNYALLFREWFYTAATRGKARVVVLYDDRGLLMALNRQKIVGRNLQEKAKTFIELENNAWANVPALPEAQELIS